LNPLLREAFDYAIDRQAIVKTSLIGYGQPGSSIIPPSTGHWYDPAVKPTPFDLSKANQLLDQAGYKMGPNGIRIANGHPMSYTVILPSDTTNGYGERSFLIVQQDFKKIGVRLTPRNLDNSAAFNAIVANHYKSFELVMWGWFPNPDPNFMLGVVTCQAWYAWSDTGYCNKSYDNLFQQQSATTNPQKRQQIVYKMQQMIYNARPYLVLDYTESIEVHSAKWVDLPTVGGVSWSTFSKIPFETLHLAG
jgi:peptide/nickel transport system substrate-binding protein